MSWLGSLSFGAPLVLVGLLALPVIWWLLRVTPPAPRRVRFYGLRFLLGLRTEEETPDKTPLWLLILRLAAAALIVAALAEPIVGTGRSIVSGGGVLVVVVDDGWAAAHRWEDRRDALRQTIGEAQRADMPVVLATTASADFDVKIEDPADALARAMALEPQPLPADRPAMLARLQAAMGERTGPVVWLADGVGGPGTAETLAALARYGEVDVYQNDGAAPALGLTPPAHDATGLSARVLRAAPGPALGGELHLFGEGGRFIAAAPFALVAGETAAAVRIELPSALRNDIERIAIEGRPSAGAVALLDESARRRPVGIVSGDETRDGQPLLSATYYLERALENAAEARRGSIGEHLQRGVSLLILADVGQIVGAEHDAVAAWVEKGGILVRFAGPRLAAGADDLLPVGLRQNGARDMGGTLSWEKPQGLGAFPAGSPFAGLAATEDIVVRRQVLAEPSLELEAHTWATLADGTPLVTATKRGEGWIVLFHVTANADWSSLPLSGLFVDMLKRVIALGRGIAGGAETAAATEGTLSPRLVLDGFGRLVKPGAGVGPIPRSGAAPSLDHPPGLYGEGPSTLAVNLLAPDAALQPFPDLPGGVAERPYGAESRFDLKPWLLGLALLMLFADAVASLLLRGYRFGLRRPAAATAAILLAATIAAAPPPARAEESADADAFALEASLQTRLAYVTTGDAEIDRMSREGLEGLTRILNDRTAVAAGEPMAVDVERDELAFFPLLYWAIPDGGQAPSAAAIERIDAYMKNGGTILFDTREGADDGPASLALQTLLKRLDLPPLQRVPREHVLTKSFYLLRDFPGRNADGEVWVEAPREDGGEATSEALGDGVSSVVIGGGDWAAAWAADEYGRPLYAMAGGGERQREYAFRFGVNLVMYALTGNYKADQVHIPALLERMGQ